MGKSDRAKEGRTDATAERKRAEDVLRTILESVRDGIITVDMSGTIVSVNEALVHLHGYDREEELVGRNIAELIVERDRNRAMGVFGELMKTGQSVLAEGALLTKDGKENPAEVSLAPMRDSSGKLIGVVAVMRDVTERKRAEEEFEKKMSELEKFHDLTVDRELKMKELEKELERLKSKLGDK